MINIDNKYSIGDVVYIKTDIEQSKRIVVSIIVNKYDLIYEIICGTLVSRHYDFEISSEKDLIQSL